MHSVRSRLHFALLLPLVCVSLRARADVAQWDFDGDLESTTGQAALLENATAAAGAPDFQFETLPIGGSSADVMHFSRGTFFRLMPGVGPNGGGQYVNQYTLVMDVMFPDRSPSEGWACLYQTNGANANDGDWFINPDGKVGISGNYGGSVPENEWHRLALVVDLVAGTYTSYVDGTQVQQNTAQVLDDRFALYSVNDGNLDGFSIFADDSGDDAEGYVNSVQFRDLALPSSEIANLGGPTADGIPIPSDPRDCSFRNFQVSFDAAANRVRGTWLQLPGERGFRVFQGARQIGADLPAAAVSFEDASPPPGGSGIVYTLKPLKAGGLVERECDSAGVDTFSCISGLACCADQAARSVRLSWSPPANITVSGFSIRRGGAEIATAPAASSTYTDASSLASGTYAYEVAMLSGGNAVCSVTCRATVTGVAIDGPGPCGGVVNTYHFDGDLKSATGGRDLIPLISAPIDAAGAPDFSFEDDQIGGKPAQVCRYSRGTIFRLFTGFGPNGGGAYTNQYTLFLDVLFEPGAIDESGWAALYQTNEANSNDGDWFIRGEDRGVGIANNYGGVVEDGEWHRLALVVDLVAGTFTSFVDGVKAQQNVGEAVDGRFSLYSFNDGDFEGITLFADDSGESSAGLVNSAQIRDVALTDQEVAAFAGPSSGGIPAEAPCPHDFVLEVDQAAKKVTLHWNKGSGLPGDGFTLRRNGATLATLPLTAESHVDSDLIPGVYVYELSLNDRESGCGNLPLTGQVEIVGDRLFFEDFERYSTDGELAAAGWESTAVGPQVENSAWTVLNPAHRANPPTFDGRPTNGRFAISDSAFGGALTGPNTAGSGTAYELVSPAFSTQGAASVWLHFDVSAQLNNVGDAVFQVDVSSDGGSTWRGLLERVSPGRLLDPLPDVSGNADGIFGRVHLDLTTLAANKDSVRLRFTHFEPTQDLWTAIDNILVDQTPADGPTSILPRESFNSGIPATWKVVSGPGSDSLGPWTKDDACGLSLGNTGGAFPDAAEGRQLHQLDGAFALVNTVCTPAKEDEYLITPVLNLSTYSRVVLRVMSAIVPTARARAEILLSIDGGNSFLPAPIFSYSSGGLVALEKDPVFTELAIDARAAAGQASAAFAFHYQSTSSADPPGTWWAIDDVQVTGVQGVSQPVFHRGDSDDNGKLELTDAIRILGFLFLGGPAPTCLDAADADDNGDLQLTDAIRILGYLFLGGAPPAPPGPPGSDCGPDPSAEIGCESYTHC